jgi:hypothetical protein
MTLTSFKILNEFALSIAKKQQESKMAQAIANFLTTKTGTQE